MQCRVKTKNPEEGNSVVELYVQVGTDDLARRSLLDMVDQVPFLVDVPKGSRLKVKGRTYLMVPFNTA